MATMSGCMCPRACPRTGESGYAQVMEHFSQNAPRNDPKQEGQGGKRGQSFLPLSRISSRLEHLAQVVQVVQPPVHHLLLRRRRQTDTSGPRPGD